MGEVSKQWEFLKAVAKLIFYAESIGYTLTGGDLFRDPRCPYGEENSFHRKRLAIDFNLFVGSEYISCPANDPVILARHKRYWERLGGYWESLGGSWGGRFTGKNKGDFNHFSWGEFPITPV